MRILLGIGEKSFRAAFMEEKPVSILADKHDKSHWHEFESENFHSQNETVVLNHKSDQTGSLYGSSSCVISNFRHLDNVYHTSDKDGFIGNRKSSQDDQEDFDTESESNDGTHDRTSDVTHDHTIDGTQDHTSNGTHEHTSDGTHDHKSNGTHDHRRDGRHDHTSDGTQDHTSDGTDDRSSRDGTQDHTSDRTHDHTRRVVLKEADSSESDSCVLSESPNQTCHSYLYKRNPLLDSRFTRLMEQLVPVRNGIQVEKKTFSTFRKENLSDKSDVICFKDICLNETCRLVFKIMSNGNDDSRKK